MYEVMAHSFALIFAGILWQIIKPQGLDGDQLRRSLTTLVYHLLLPALVLVVIWRSPLSWESLAVAVLAAAAVLLGLTTAWLWFRRRAVAAPTLGAILLASAFPNATYLGLPVLEAALGPWARSIAVQYDLFAATPLLLTVGIMIAIRHGQPTGVAFRPLANLLRVPPLWAAIIAVLLNLLGVPLPESFGNLLDKLAAGVVPLMLFSLGLGLRWQGEWQQRLPYLLPIIIIQLLWVPLVVWGLSLPLTLHPDVRVAIVLEAAMPSMVLGIVLCDRYGLDTPLFAMAVTLTTAVSAFTLPLWFYWLGSA
jgi:malate permease and related proteins